MLQESIIINLDGELMNLSVFIKKAQEIANTSTEELERLMGLLRFLGHEVSIHKGGI